MNKKSDPCTAFFFFYIKEMNNEKTYYQQTKGIIKIT